MYSFIGSIAIFAGDTVPEHWALCDGSILDISSNTALFSLLGNAYGGDGKTTFALPDLRGRAVVGIKPGDPSFDKPGAYGGSEIVQLTPAMFPAHTHELKIAITPGAASIANSSTPENAVYATGAFNLYNFGDPDTFMAPYDAHITTSEAGTNTNKNIPVPILHPVLALNYIICVKGYNPSRE